MPRNLFEAASPAAKAGLKKAKKQMTLEGIEMVASIKAVEDALESVKELYEGSVKVEMHKHFVADGAARHVKPENFEGIDGDGNASCQLKKRSSASKLNELDKDVLGQYGVPVDTIARTFKLSEAVASNPDLMQKISDVLSEHVPEIAELREPMFEEIAEKTIVSDESIAHVFRMNDPDTIAKILPIVTTLAIRPKLKDGMPETLKRAFARVAAALSGDLDIADPRQRAKGRAETLPTFARAKKKEWTS